jgi:hypothetical protein
VRLLRSERWRAEVIARALVPRGVLGGTTDGIDAGALLDQECQGGPWHAALLLKLGIWLVWLWPLPRLRTFASLPEREREEQLERLLEHRLYFVRQALLYLKLTVLAVLLGGRPQLLRAGAYRLAGPGKGAA